MQDSKLVTGLFRDRDSAERAYQRVTERGYGRDDVNRAGSARLNTQRPEISGLAAV